MSKKFNELKKGDKVYLMEISNNRISRKDGKTIEVAEVRDVRERSTLGYEPGSMEIVLNTGRLFFPQPYKSSLLYKNSVDTSMLKNLNAYVYGTSKRDCIEACVAGIRESNSQQLETLEKFREKIKENNSTLKTLDEMLETADYPETVLEFAEMALE